jgi:hypothetical protein
MNLYLIKHFTYNNKAIYQTNNKSIQQLTIKQ